MAACLDTRERYGSYYPVIWQALLVSLEGINEPAPKSSPDHFKYRTVLRKQVKSASLFFPSSMNSNIRSCFCTQLVSGMLHLLSLRNQEDFLELQQMLLPKAEYLLDLCVSAKKELRKVRAVAPSSVFLSSSFRRERATNCLPIFSWSFSRSVAIRRSACTRNCCTERERAKDESWCQLEHLRIQ